MRSEHTRSMARAPRQGLTGLATVMLLLAGTIAGCSVTQKATVEKSSLSASGFLGPDYARLTPGGKDQTSLRYVNPSAQWTQYTKILVMPVSFWGDEATKIPLADQQALCNFLYQALRDQLGKKFRLVEQPGPGVMVVQVALTDVAAATPVLRSVTMVIPQARALSTLKYLATGTYPFVGAAQAEAKITDGGTGELLGEWVDKRVGGGNIQTAAQWQWGDVENVMNAWAAMAAEKLYSWTSGTASPTA
jgi:Protein of unknown function (DUF3313)